MFNIAQSVTNNAEAPSALPPTAFSPAMASLRTLKNFFILHEGVVAMADGELTETDCGDIPIWTRSMALRQSVSTV